MNWHPNDKPIQNTNCYDNLWWGFSPPNRCLSLNSPTIHHYSNPSSTSPIQQWRFYFIFKKNKNKNPRKIKQAGRSPIFYFGGEGEFVQIKNWQESKKMILFPRCVSASASGIQGIQGKVKWIISNVNEKVKEWTRELDNNEEDSRSTTRPTDQSRELWKCRILPSPVDWDNMTWVRVLCVTTMNRVSSFNVHGFYRWHSF